MKLNKDHLWSWPGMKEIKLPKPIKCPYCKKLVGWYISDDQHHYKTKHHMEFIGNGSLVHHYFDMSIPRYE